VARWIAEKEAAEASADGSLTVTYQVIDLLLVGATRENPAGVEGLLQYSVIDLARGPTGAGPFRPGGRKRQGLRPRGLAAGRR